MAEDERIHVYYLYRDGNPAAIEAAHERALEEHDAFRWEGPFLRTPFGTVSVGCEDVAAEMTGMDSVANQTYETGDDEWDLFDSPLCIYTLRDGHAFGSDGGGHSESSDDPIAQFAELVATGYRAADETPLGVHAQPPMIRAGVHSTDSPPFTAESLAHDAYDFLSWVTVFAPPVVETYGREALLSAPAPLVEELDDGAVLLVAYDDPLDPQPDGYADVADHIGLETY